MLLCLQMRKFFTNSSEVRIQFPSASRKDLGESSPEASTTSDRSADIFVELSKRTIASEVKMLLQLVEVQGVFDGCPVGGYQGREKRLPEHFRMDAVLQQCNNM